MVIATITNDIVRKKNKILKKIKRLKMYKNNTIPSVREWVNDMLNRWEVSLNKKINELESIVTQYNDLLLLIDKEGENNASVL